MRALTRSLCSSIATALSDFSTGRIDVAPLEKTKPSKIMNQEKTGKIILYSFASIPFSVIITAVLVSFRFSEFANVGERIHNKGVNVHCRST